MHKPRESPKRHIMRRLQHAVRGALTKDIISHKVEQQVHTGRALH